MQAVWPWYSPGLDDETGSPEPDNESVTNESEALIGTDEENVEGHELEPL